MIVKPKNTLFALLTVVAFLASACGSAASNQDTIATAVAQTVQAQNASSTEVVPASTSTVISPPSPLSTLPAPTLTATPRPTLPPVTAKDQDCMKASLIDETIPDGTIMKPGQQFTKVWRIRNDSSCVWNTSYKIVFWDGDVMGGGYVYNFPQSALPGDTVDVPLVLIAPSSLGEFKGSWKLQTPSGYSFGVGYDSPFWVDIVVGTGTPENNKTETAFSITSLTYELNHRCTTANQFDTVIANITSNGPITINVKWLQSDGVQDANNKVVFTEATTKSITHEWHWGSSSSRNPRWVKAIITSPFYQEYSEFTLLTTCW